MYNNFSEADYYFIRELSKIGFVKLSSSQVTLLDANAGSNYDHSFSFKKHGVGENKSCEGFKLPENWVLSVLHVLDYYVFEENYEECQKIIDAIKEQEEKLKTTIFTTITEQTIKEVKEVYSKFNLTGDNALEHSKYYATLILKEINEKYVVS